MKNTVVLILVLSFFVSILNAQSSNDLNEIKPAKNSHISFKNVIYDFGTIKYGEEAVGVFEFKNISKETIRLTNVKASCGCTGTEWPREEIKRKKKNSITVTYDTKRVGKFHKTVYVYIDKSDNPIQLQVKGTVLPSENATGNVKSVAKIKDNKIATQKHIQVDASTRKTANPGAKNSQTIETKDSPKATTPRIEKDNEDIKRIDSKEKQSQPKETVKEVSKIKMN